MNATVVSVDKSPFDEYSVYQNLQADLFLEGDIVASLRLLADEVRASGTLSGKGAEKIVPCLSGYHPHPLYVVCLLGLQARAGAGALRRRSG